MERNLSVESLSEPVQNLKKLRKNSIEKHTPNSAPVVDPIANEIEKHLKLDVNSDDLLQFWRLSGDRFPNLKILAQIVFSTTSLILNAKRTMLLSENVSKIQMIHDNYNLFKPV